MHLRCKKNVTFELSCNKWHQNDDKRTKLIKTNKVRKENDLLPYKDKLNGVFS